MAGVRRWQDAGGPVGTPANTGSPAGPATSPSNRSTAIGTCEEGPVADTSDGRRRVTGETAAQCFGVSAPEIAGG